MQEVIHRPDASENLTRWAVELGKFTIDFVPTAAVKAHTLADFKAEFTTTVETVYLDCVVDGSTMLTPRG